MSDIPKNCPFCGDSAFEYEIEGRTQYTCAHAHCAGADVNASIKLWNTRPAPVSPRDAVSKLPWARGQARSSLGDLYEVVQLSENVFVTYKNAVAFSEWRSTRDEAVKRAQDDYERLIVAAPLPAPNVGAEEMDGHSDRLRHSLENVAASLSSRPPQLRGPFKSSATAPATPTSRGELVARRQALEEAIEAVKACSHPDVLNQYPMIGPGGILAVACTAIRALSSGEG